MSHDHTTRATAEPCTSSGKPWLEKVRQRRHSDAQHCPKSQKMRDEAAALRLTLSTSRRAAGQRGSTGSERSAGGDGSGATQCGAVKGSDDKANIVDISLSFGA